MTTEPETTEPELEAPKAALPPLADTGQCQNGHIVWSGGPPSEGEFPLTCRFCEVQVPRPGME